MNVDVLILCALNVAGYGRHLRRVARANMGVLFLSLVPLQYVLRVALRPASSGFWVQAIPA
jgi:hypothetical protein